MASTDSRPVPRKNAAFRYYFAVRKNDGTLITTWAGQDSEVSLDGAAFSDCTNEATEIGTSGVGYIDLTSGEMNADAVCYKLTVSNTSALPIVVTFFPEEIGDYRANVEQFGGSNGTFSGGRPDVNTTHAGGTAWGSGAITAGSIAADAVTEIQSGLSTLTAAQVNAEVDTALADYDGPTNAELTTALASADDATLAAIGALNNLSSAEAQTAAAAALTAYDGPTNAEMEARTLAAASYATAANQAAIAGYIDTEVGAIISAIAALNNISTADVLAQVAAALTAPIADSMPADGTRPSISAGIYMLVQFMTDRAVTGTTATVYKPDGTTSLFTLTLNDGTAPTAVTRAT